MKRRKIITLCAIGSLLGAMAIGGTYSYLTDAEKATNKFTVGEVQIDLTEPNFPENNKEHPLVPNEEVKKDPTITNTGVNDAIVFMEFDIPVRNISVVNADGTNKQSGNNEVFDFASGENGYDSVGEGWVLISSSFDNDDNPTKKTYIYGYNKKLANDAETTPIFDKVKLANIVEGTLEGEELQVDVKALAIQSEYVNSIDTTTLDKATLEDVYTVFKNQNPDSSEISEANTNNDLNLKGTEIVTE